VATLLSFGKISLDHVSYCLEARALIFPPFSRVCKKVSAAPPGNEESILRGCSFFRADFIRVLPEVNPQDLGFLIGPTLIVSQSLSHLIEALLLMCMSSGIGRHPPFLIELFTATVRDLLLTSSFHE